MYAFKIKGGNQLTGSVSVKGAKNAILPIMAASLLTAEPLHLKNISFLSDVNTMNALLSSLGVCVKTNADELILTADHISSTKAAYDFVSKMRASFWVLGPLLARFQEATVSLPGGCAIGARPVDLYLMALTEMGADIRIENGYVIAKGPLHGAEIFFPKVSVGATHNTIMAAVLTAGTTIIHNPALEPEVMDLISVLKKMGAQIEGIGTKKLIIHGVSKLSGTTHSVIADRIETASFVIATAMTKGKIEINGGRQDLIGAVTDLLLPSQISFQQTDHSLIVDATNACLKSVPVITSEYPGFPTDAQALMTSFLSISTGDARVSEHIFENRFMHIPELQRMGAHIDIIDGHSVFIHGVPELSGATVMASDLRGGVGLVLAGLVAKGETLVKRIYHIDRGYYHLEEKLTQLGADIRRVHLDD